MYFLVEFIENKSMNIVPETWVEDGMTWWPNYTKDDRINRAIQKKEIPGDDWTRHDVRILIKTG